MDPARLQEIIETLEREVAAAEGKSRLSWPEDYAVLTANEAGLLRLACTLLRAAKEPIRADDCRSEQVWVDHRVDQIVEDDVHDMILGPVDRMETWPEPKQIILQRGRKDLWKYRVQLIGCVIVAVALTVVFTAGVMAIWTFVRGLL